MGKNPLLEELFSFVKSKGTEIRNEAVDVLKEKSTGYLREKISNTSPAPGSQKKKQSGVGAPADSRQEGEQGKITGPLSKEQEDRFLENLPEEFLRAAPVRIGDPQAALEAVHRYLSTAGEVVKFCELQETRRAEIQSRKECLLASIDAQKQVLLLYLEKTFDERSAAFDQFFKVVDDALRKNNVEQLMAGLNSINTLAASSPFKGLENVQAALKNKNTVWEL